MNQVLLLLMIPIKKLHIFTITAHCTSSPSLCGALSSMDLLKNCVPHVVSNPVNLWRHIGRHYCYNSLVTNRSASTRCYKHFSFLHDSAQLSDSTDRQLTHLHSLFGWSKWKWKRVILTLIFRRQMTN